MARRHPRNINPEDLKLTKSKFKTVGRLWKELLSHRGLLFFVYSCIVKYNAWNFRSIFNRICD